MNMKEQLKDGYTVVYRDGGERTVNCNELHFEGIIANFLTTYNDDLKNNNGFDDSGLDIISIRDENNVEIWKRDGNEWVDVSKANEVIDSMIEEPKPILPRKDHERNRIKEICQAIIRYTEAGKEVPSEWMDELNDLI